MQFLICSLMMVIIYVNRHYKLKLKHILMLDNQEMRCSR